MKEISGASGTITGRSAVLLTVVLCVAIFVGATTSFSPLALLPYIANGLGTNVALVGQVSSVSIFLGAVMAVSFGTLIRRYGYRSLYLIGTLAMLLSATLMSVAPNVLVVLVAALLCSLANAIITPVALAIVATELSPQASRRAMSYQIACVFIAVAVGIPGGVFVAGLLGWRGTFVVLAILSLLLLTFVARIVPIGTRDPSTRFDLGHSVSSYREILRNRSLGMLYAFLVLYVLCSFGSGAYVSALVVSRGANSSEVAQLWVVAGVAFVVSSVVAGELLGRLTWDLRFLILAGFPIFILARGIVYFSAPSFGAILVLVALAQLCDGTMAVAMRSLVAGYSVRDHALSMVLFSACESLGQAIGGVTAGLVLALGGFPSVGELTLVIGFLAFWLPTVSRRLQGRVTAADSLA